METLKSTSAITDPSTDEKALLRTVDKLMQKKTEEQLPPSSDNTTLHFKIRYVCFRKTPCVFSNISRCVVFNTPLYDLQKHSSVIFSRNKK